MTEFFDLLSSFAFVLLFCWCCALLVVLSAVVVMFIIYQLIRRVYMDSKYSEQENELAAGG
jgi:membrane protein YdbS with pleckstrin-like domain